MKVDERSVFLMILRILFHLGPTYLKQTRVEPHKGDDWAIFELGMAFVSLFRCSLFVVGMLSTGQASSRF